MHTLQKPDFIRYLHSFRGLAILAIIGAHAWSMLGSMSGLQESNPDYIWIYASTETLFHGATLFFALISGILYSQVLHNQSWRAFFSNKALNVLLPYVFISLLLTALAWPEYLAYGKANGIDFFFPEELVKNITRGQAQLHLWYIPILIALFLLTPLLATLRTPANGLGLLALGLLPLVCSRSVYPDLLSLKTLGYFLGAYALGMYIGQYLDATQRIIRRYRAELCLALLAFSSANFLLFVWEYRPDGFVSWHQSVVYVQKVLMALLALHLLQHRGESQPRLLGVLGTHAFSLYFLHMTFVWILCDTILKLKPELHLLDMLWAGALIYVLSIIGSLLVSMALRKILGRRSRWLIGA